MNFISNKPTTPGTYVIMDDDGIVYRVKVLWLIRTVITCAGVGGKDVVEEQLAFSLNGKLCWVEDCNWN